MAGTVLLSQSVRGFHCCIYSLFPTSNFLSSLFVKPEIVRAPRAFYSMILKLFVIMNASFFKSLFPVLISEQIVFFHNLNVIISSKLISEIANNNYQLVGSNFRPKSNLS